MLGLALTTAVLAASAPAECWARPEHGSGFPVCFDAWDGVEVGVAGGARAGERFGEATFGFRMSNGRDEAEGARRTWLTVQHGLFGELGAYQGQWAATATAWEGVFRRHLHEGVLAWPSNPPVALPFPFDVSVMGSGLRWERRAADGSDWSLELGRAGALLDLLRSPSHRFHLGLGPTAAWRVRSVGGVWAHDVTPLSAAQLFATFESQDGLWVLRGGGVAGWQLAPFTGGAATLRAHGELSAERVLLAVNDEPVALVVRARGAWADAGARLATEWALTVGLTVRLGSAVGGP